MEMFVSNISLKDVIAAKKKYLILLKGVKPGMGDKLLNQIQKIVKYFC